MMKQGDEGHDGNSKVKVKKRQAERVRRRPKRDDLPPETITRQCIKLPVPKNSAKLRLDLQCLGKNKNCKHPLQGADYCSPFSNGFISDETKD